MYGSLIRIREIINDLNPSEKKIAEYILNKPKEISDLSIKDLADKSGSSQSAVVRLCKILNYKGYKEFRIMIAKDTASKVEGDSRYTDINPKDDLDTIIKNISYNNKKSIDNTMEVLSAKEIETAVNVISKADRIDFYGIGASYIVALDAFQKFMRINKNVRATSDTHLQVECASNLRKGDVAVAISYSGETRDTFESIKVAKEAGATTISITKFGSNSISDLCDINLFVLSPEITFRSGAMSSRIAQLNVIDILFTSVAGRMLKDVKTFLENTRKSTKGKRIK
ncbi:MurR/RpiR family transcriptional regulator [Clostridium felsineum]|uniref:MurR/RpiR family transcriptional regulator n=1 Tax=Clostridium felsineum TaxID=36839 RepID=UPI00098BDDFF|nr:MurR/RpiR family transcriptional regulator [Clostridium felsineum]URZ18349.1 putative HTH-type transcriptional regulator YbbH [Clostridium felsineum DSM 794]